MNRVLFIFLQVAIVLIGLIVLTLLLWEPHLEGRNVNATLFQIYFNDPFLAYVYTAFIAFFVGLYQVFKLIGYIGQNKLFSPISVRALKVIKYCAITFVGFFVGAVAYILFVQRGREDIAGGVAVGLFIILMSIVVAIVAAMFETKLKKAERNLQSAINTRPENDSTVYLGRQ